MAVKTEFTYPSGDSKTQIRALRWVPDEGISPVGVLQIIHGMQEFIDRYDDFASFMAAHGFIVTGCDLPGHGGSIRDGNENYFGYFGDNDYSEGNSTNPAGETDGNKNLIRAIRALQMLTQDLYPELPYQRNRIPPGSGDCCRYVSVESYRRQKRLVLPQSVFEQSGARGSEQTV